MKELEGFVIDACYAWGGTNCFWCGVAVVYSETQSPKQATRDHLIPRMQRPLFNLTNGLLVLSCFRCNNARGANMRWRPRVPTQNAQEFIERTRLLVWRTPEYLKVKPPQSKRKRIIRSGQKPHGLTKTR